MLKTKQTLNRLIKTQKGKFKYQTKFKNQETLEGDPENKNCFYES